MKRAHARFCHAEFTHERPTARRRRRGAPPMPTGPRCWARPGSSGSPATASTGPPGARSGHIPFRNIRRLRLSYRPASMQSHRFMTELWADGAPKLEILSSSWKSMVEQERLDKPYAAFVAELHRRIALAARAGALRAGQQSAAVLAGPDRLRRRGARAGRADRARACRPTPWAARPSSAAFWCCFSGRAAISFAATGRAVYRPEALPAELMPKG